MISLAHSEKGGREMRKWTVSWNIDYVDWQAFLKLMLLCFFVCAIYIAFGHLVLGFPLP